MFVLVTGANGQLGSDLCKELVKHGHTVYKTGTKNISEHNYFRLDITKKEDVEQLLVFLKPDAVIHCAAWTAVDEAEKIPNKAMVSKVNFEGTKNIAEVCKVIGAKMIYISTDYVFDGTGERPWEADSVNFGPLNVYGKTKLDGELSVSMILEKYFIVRISWVFGKNGNNFVKTMLKLSETHKDLSVISDQIGTPTYTPDISKLLCEMVESDKYGYYNATNEGGFISWFDFAVEIFKQKGIDMNVSPVLTKDYRASLAKRPLNSRLDKSKLSKNGFTALPDWKDALSRYIREIE